MITRERKSLRRRPGERRGMFAGWRVSRTHAYLRRQGADSLQSLAERHQAGGEPPAPDPGKAAGGEWSLREALMTWQLYALWALFFLNTTAGLAILSEAQPLAASIGGASATLAAA